MHVGGDDPKVDPWAVDYGRITPLLVQSIQDQQKQIEAQQQEIKELKSQLAEMDELKAQLNRIEAALNSGNLTAKAYE